MAGAETLGNLTVILGALVGIFDQHGNRRACRRHRLAVLVQHHAGQNLHDVVLAALGHEAALAGLALVHPVLHLGKGKADAGRATIYHAAK